MENSILNTNKNFKHLLNNILNIFNSINLFIFKNFHLFYSLYSNTGNYVFINIYKPINRLFYKNIYNKKEINSVLIIEKYVSSYLKSKKLNKEKNAVNVIQNAYLKYLNKKRFNMNQIIIPNIKRKYLMEQFNRIKVATLILQKHYNNYYINQNLNIINNLNKDEKNDKLDINEKSTWFGWF